MSATETHISRITRAIGSVTSIFRCHGLQAVAPNADRIGGHDVFYWMCFLALISVWFLFVYMPQCWRYEKLAGRQQALNLEMESDKKELERLKRGIASLNNGDALAWERAARKRLGWLEPGELLDTHRTPQTRTASNPMSPVPNSAPTPVLSRPRVPPIPHAPGTFAQNPPLATRTTLHYADSGALGPAAFAPAPPPMPIVPMLPPRWASPVVQQRVSVPAGLRRNHG
ncbi:MAG TPA: hypothetical protein VKX17_14500 [Planctomycetota bacterium]|nr:hypothetical protein [Planctomycetota bacterium]